MLCVVLSRNNDILHRCFTLCARHYLHLPGAITRDQGIPCVSTQLKQQHNTGWNEVDLVLGNLPEHFSTKLFESQNNDVKVKKMCELYAN